MEWYLPVIWAALLGAAVALYVILDGFDLGIGILFPFAREEKERDQMINSIAPRACGSDLDERAARRERGRWARSGLECLSRRGRAPFPGLGPVVKSPDFAAVLKPAPGKVRR